MSRLARPLTGPIVGALRAGLLLLTLIASLPSAGHAGPGHSGDEGHSHDAPATASSQSPRVVATSEAYQLVGILKDGVITLYLDREADNAPVANAAIEVSGGDATAMAEAQQDGTYTVAAEQFAKPGENELQFSIKDGEPFDLLGGVLIVPGAAADHSGHSGETAWLDRPVPAGWAVLAGIGILVVGVAVGGLFSRRSQLGAVLLLAALCTASVGERGQAGPGHSGDEGHAHGPEVVEGASDSPRRLPDGSVFVPKPTQRLLEVRTRHVAPETVRRALRMPGRVIPNPARTAIVQSTVDGRIAPFNGKFAHVGQRVNAGETLGYVQPVMAEIDRSDFEQTAGHLDQEIALAKNRVEQYKKFSTFPAERVRTAEIELESLVRRRATLTQRKSGNEELVAPIDGVIVSAQALIGQVVSPKDILFEIVDPGSLWVEALAYESVKSEELGAAKALAHDAQLADLKYVSHSPSLNQHATAIKFEVASSPAGIEIGRHVTVLAELGEDMTGIVLPREAVVQSFNGQHVVFKHLEPERFETRPVRFVEVDGSRVLLTAGVEPGEKIVVDAASLINQIR